MTIYTSRNYQEEEKEKGIQIQKFPTLEFIDVITSYLNQCNINSL
jgi:hypothetical protein